MKMVEQVKFKQNENISNKKDINELSKHYIQGETNKNSNNINNNDKNINIISNFGQEKSPNHDNIKSYISNVTRVTPNKNISQHNETKNGKNVDNEKMNFKKSYYNVINGNVKERALTLIDQQNAIHEMDDLINIDKDHRFAHGENHISHRKRKMSIQIDESQSKKNFKPNHRRRGSLDSKTKPEQFIINVAETQSKILEQEDTNGDFQITIDDKGPKTFNLGTLNSDGYRKKDIRGTYALSNLLQELALATSYGREVIVLNEERLNEYPIDRLHRIIKYHFWDALTRRIDEQGLELILCDSKNESADHKNRIYIPFDDTRALNYYNDIAKRRKDLKLDVIQLPKIITPQYVKSIDNYPGILALALREEEKIDNKCDNGNTQNIIIRGVPFVVPGGRFNEMYGWDSYFETLGLLIDERPLLGKSMVDNFVYQIEHYGKILNANRSYYLTRSQPPFLTDMINKIYYEGLLPKLNKSSNNDTDNLFNSFEKKIDVYPKKSKFVKTRPKPLTKKALSEWQNISFTAAIKELLSVWLNDPRIERKSGLSCYHTEGFGVPPETEASHFDAIFTEFGKKTQYGLERI